MRHWMLLVENLWRKSVLYHGTRPDRLASVLAHGLKKRWDTSYRLEEFGPGIYLTDNIEIATSYGPVVLEIDMYQLYDRYLAPDDYELVDYFAGEWGDYDPEADGPHGVFECSWLDSLAICHQCKYLNDIPPEAITVVGK